MASAQDDYGESFGEPKYDLRSSDLDPTWRPCHLKWTEEEYEKIRGEIAAKIPLHDESHTYKILLVGSVRAGKSSVINTMFTALRNEIGQIALNAEDDVSITKKFRVYRLRKSVKERAIRVTLCDTMGFEQTEALSGPTIRDIEYILDGNIKDGYEFNTQEAISYNDPKFEKNPGPMDKIHAVVFVVEAGSAGTLNVDVLGKLKEVAQKCNKRDIRWAVIMTKIDCACPDVDADIANTFKSMPIKECVDSVNESFGVIKSNIFPIRNYGSQTEVDKKMNILALDNLRHILRLADNTLESQIMNEGLPADAPAEEPLGESLRDASDLDEKSVKASWESLTGIDIQSVSEVRIALFGPKGAGKSAFINSCYSELYQRLVTFADTGSKDTPTTTHYNEYTMKTGRNDEPLPVKLIDTMGFLAENGGLLKEDVTSVLDGKIEPKTPFNPSVPIKTSSEARPLEERAHLFCMVVDGSQFDKYPDALLSRLKEAMDVSKDQLRGIPQVVVVTHLDEACPHVKRDPATLYRSLKTRRVVESINKKLQVPKVNILPVVNFANDTSLNWKKSYFILKTLSHLIVTAEDYIENHMEEEKPKPKKKGWFW